IKELELSKKKVDDEIQLLYSFLLNEIGSKDLDNLKELLAGRKLTEILSELDNRKQVIQNLDSDLTIKREELSNVCSQSKYFEEKTKTQEKEANTKKEIINMLEKTIKKRDEEYREQIMAIFAYLAKDRQFEYRIKAFFILN
ncbi:1142_t:CDS:2, partial [Funneliformis mosseae]